MSPESITIQVDYSPLYEKSQNFLDWDFTAETYDPASKHMQLVIDRLKLMALDVKKPSEGTPVLETPELLGRVIQDITNATGGTPAIHASGGALAGDAWEIDYFVNSWSVTIWYWPAGYNDEPVEDFAD